MGRGGENKGEEQDGAAIFFAGLVCVSLVFLGGERREERRSHNILFYHEVFLEVEKRVWLTY